MRNYLLCFGLLWLFSCNKEIEIVSTVDSAVDYNVLIVPPDTALSRQEQQGIIQQPIELYLRQFSPNENASYYITFSSNNYSWLKINNQTLYTGDRVLVNYSSFKNNKLSGMYFVETRFKGKQEVVITITSNGQDKKATSSFTL